MKVTLSIEIKDDSFDEHAKASAANEAFWAAMVARAFPILRFSKIDVRMARDNESKFPKFAPVPKPRRNVPATCAGCGWSIDAESKTKRCELGSDCACGAGVVAR